MKELSIEEKAKAYGFNYKTYTELINRLEDVKNAIKKQNYGIAMDILYKPYPEYQITTSTELKESEDERIRKAIIQFFELQDDNTTYSFIPKKDILAWLEKQGEQKPAEYNKEIPTDLKDIVDNEANAIWEEESTDGCHLVIDSFNMFYGICMQIAETVVDYRKPAWSEEDEENFKWFDKFFRAESVISEGKDIPQDRYLWFKNLKDRVQPQSKQEWSEEEQQIIEDAACIILDCVNTAETEKEEKRLEELADKLQDLKPQSQWKPSDEQMKALRYAAEKDGCNHVVLIGLISDLEKLTE